jgi:hypothetical protein
VLFSEHRHKQSTEPGLVQIHWSHVISPPPPKGQGAKLRVFTVLTSHLHLTLKKIMCKETNQVNKKSHSCEAEENPGVLYILHVPS